jgi:hypothetical protein
LGVVSKWQGNVRNSFIWPFSKAIIYIKPENRMDLRNFLTKYDSMLILSPEECSRAIFRESAIWKVLNKNKVQHLKNNRPYFQKSSKFVDTVILRVIAKFCSHVKMSKVSSAKQLRHCYFEQIVHLSSITVCHNHLLTKWQIRQTRNTMLSPLSVENDRVIVSQRITFRAVMLNQKPLTWLALTNWLKK